MKNPLFTDMLNAAKQNEGVAPAEESSAVVVENTVSAPSKVIGRPARKDAALRNKWLRARVSEEESIEVKTYCIQHNISADELVRVAVLDRVRK